MGRIMTHNMGRASVILDLENRGGLGRNEEDKKMSCGGRGMGESTSFPLSLFFPSPEAGRRERMGTRLRVKWAYIQQG